ncbi:Cell division protein 48 [Spironucleus salmonicida]|uniref:Cell division protein 48 n=2 Tax=Spironucleus salmonicida TaxID=348837 RepID=A0A9P8LXK1_9EUKA|nr:Cell division protein 48 [Spironucleus salmonicida]
MLSLLHIMTKPSQDTEIKKGHTGDYVIKKTKTELSEMRFPNRFIVEDYADGDNSVVQINPTKFDQLELFQDDIVEIRGRFKKFTHAMVTPNPSLDPTKILMNKSVRKNANVNLGDIVSIHAAPEVQQGARIKILPFNDDVAGYTEDFFDTHIRPFFKDKFRPITENDTFIINEGPKPIEFKVVLVDPSPVCIVAEGVEIFTEGDPISREEDEKTRKEMIGYSDLGGIKKELQQIREMIELPLKHPQLFENLGIKPPRGILMHGPPGCGKSSIGRAIANETGAFFLLINGPEIMSSMAGESEKNLRSAFEKADEEALARGCAIIFIDEIDVIGGSREESKGEVEKRIVSQLLTLMDGIKPRSNVLVLAATNRPNALDASLRRFGRFDREICLSVPDIDGRLSILKIKTKKMRLAEDIDFEYLADNTNGFVGADIAQLCTEAAMLCIREKSEMIDFEEANLPAGMIDSMFIEMAHFKTALNSINPSTLRDTVVEMPKTTWDDIGGLHEVKKNLKELIQYPIQYADQYERLGIDPSRGCLFFGPPGNGKTLLAKAIANECQSNFISVKGPELMSKWVGESERGVRQIFDKARQAQPCVLFLDELDSIAKHRGGGGGGEGVTDRMVNQLLTEIDGVGAKKSVFVIGATNRPDTIDPALIRGGRLDQLIYIGIPDYDGRFGILSAALRKSKIEDGIDLQKIAQATDGYSGADLSEICQKAVQFAIRNSVRKFNEGMAACDGDMEAARRLETEFQSGVIQKEDFVNAVRESRQSVSSKDLIKYEAFKEMFCGGASKGSSSNEKIVNFDFESVGALLKRKPQGGKKVLKDDEMF